MNDFFISYNAADKHYAMGIGNWLDQALYTTVLQEQDFLPGSNFVSEMHHALRNSKRVLMVLSPTYLAAKFPESEWTAAFANDPTGSQRTLIGVRVRECKPEGLLKPLVYIDLVGLAPDVARQTFLSGIAAAMKGQRKNDTSLPNSPAVEPRTTPTNKSIRQSATGNRNVLVAGDLHYHGPTPKPEKVFAPRDGAISAEQARQVQIWIERLVENTVGIERSPAFGMWQNRLKNHFRVDKYQEIRAADFELVESWFVQQNAILKRKLRTKAPDAWRNERYGAIKGAMRQMGVEKEAYYPDISIRLKMKKPFASLKDLTKRDLERVYLLVLRDARGG